jgi:hypothetical protein
MSPRESARCVVLTLALAGCGLSNPTVVVGPDSAARVDGVVGPEASVVDVATDLGAVDVGRDAGDAPDVAMRADVPIDLGNDALEGDSGPPDSGEVDAGMLESGVVDTGVIDSGVRETGVIDAGPPDSGVVDSGPRDTGPADTGIMDTGVVDSGPPDIGPPDTGPVDAGFDVPVIPDTGPPDAGTITVTSYTENCTTTGTGPVNGPGHYLLSGTTVGRGSDHRPSCADNSAPDIGFLVTLPTFSRLSWTARPFGTANFSPVVYLTQNCATQGGGDTRYLDEVACVTTDGAPAHTRSGYVDLPAGNYYLAVDGDDNNGTPNSGPFEVTLDVVASETSRAYSVERLTGRTCPTPPSGSVLINDGDDVVSSTRTLPFTVQYFGVPLARLAAYDNGFFTFLPDGAATPSSPSLSWRNPSLAFSGLPAGVVAPFWDDLVVSTSGSSDVNYWVDGTTPDRVAHLYWGNVQFYRDTGTRVSFDVRLVETSNVIEFTYCSESRMTNASRGDEATIGLESLDQAAGVLVGLNAANSVAPGTGYRFVPR